MWHGQPSAQPAAKSVRRVRSTRPGRRSKADGAKQHIQDPQWVTHVDIIIIIIIILILILILILIIVIINAENKCVSLSVTLPHCLKVTQT